MKNNILPRKIKIGYGAGSFFEAGVYNFVTTFLLVYLTTVAHLPAATAGAICSISVLLEAVGGIFAGHLSDQSYTKYGRRRPFILVAGIVGCISTCLIFVDVSFLGDLRIIYYYAVTILLWITFSFFYIPYIALAVEMTNDYHERQTIRSYCRIFSILGNLLCTVTPLWAVGALNDRGFDLTTSWFIFAVFMSSLTGICAFISWKTTNGMEPTYDKHSEKPKKRSLVALFKDYWEILHLKSVVILLLSKSFFTIAYTLYTSSFVYFMMYKLGFSNSFTSMVFLIGILASLLYTPIIDICAKKIDKHNMIILSFLMTGVMGITISIADISGAIITFIYICIFTFAHSSFWQIHNALFYDMTEVDEYRYGKRRDGSITSLMSVLGTCFVSLAIYIVGALLEASGFIGDAIVQNQTAIEMIDNLFVFYPSIMLACGGAVLLFYPMNKHRFEVLKKAIELKKNNQEVGELKEIVEKLY